MPLSPGQILNSRYSVLRLLGQGGMGAVYLAEDGNLPGRQVALKENLDRTQAAQDQFKREATILALLKHPNLPQVTDHFVLPSGEQYLVMEHVDGEDLDEIVRRRGPLPEAEVLGWMNQVMDALEYMHTWVDPVSGHLTPVVHRDIKPGNIKRTPQGGIVLVDFGVAKYLQSGGTLTGARAASPGFSPLEQYTGGTDVRSDIYSLGATLYCLLTGQVPPEAPDLAAGRASLTPPQTLAPGMSANTGTAIMRAMQLSVASRYRSVGEMRQALSQRQQVWWGNRGIQMAMAVVATAILLGTGALASWLWARPIRGVPTPTAVALLAATPASVSVTMIPPMTAAASLTTTSTPDTTSPLTPTVLPTLTKTPSPTETALPIFAETPSPTAASVPQPLLTVKVNVNVRSGPGTNYDVIGGLRSGETREITGRNADSSWWQIDFVGRPGWVSSQVVTADASAVGVTVAASPPSPTPRPRAAAGATAISPVDGMVQVFVPAGEFLMGSLDDDADADPDEKPRHRVYLDAYWIDRTEVTNAQYRACVEAGACEHPPDDQYDGLRRSPYADEVKANHPVVWVNWYRAEAYCRWAGRRLPTEAEWEKAARGTDGRGYPWGGATPDCTLANFDVCLFDTAPVGSYPAGASPYGILDMAGNVLEWVADWHAESTYANSPAANPVGPNTGSSRVLRGGWWSDYRSGNLTAVRYTSSPHNWNGDIGFRCARSP